VCPVQRASVAILELAEQQRQTHVPNGDIGQGNQYLTARGQQPAMPHQDIQRIGEVFQHVGEENDIELLPAVEWVRFRTRDIGHIGLRETSLRFFGSAQEFVGRAGIAEVGLNSQFADG